MTEDITRQPLARAVLTTLARSRGGDDPLGSLARAVLAGESDLRTAAALAEHGEALDDAFAESLARRDDLTPGQQAEYDRQARQLRDTGDSLSVEADEPDDGDCEKGRR